MCLSHHWHDSRAGLAKSFMERNTAGLIKDESQALRKKGDIEMQGDVKDFTGMANQSCNLGFWKDPRESLVVNMLTQELTTVHSNKPVLKPSMQTDIMFFCGRWMGCCR